MGNVLHFNPNADATAVCGQRVFLCDDYTDVPDNVDCGRCKRTRAFMDYDPRRFNIDVWDHEGNVVRWLKHCTAEDVEMIKKEYADIPTVSVVVAEI